MALYTVDRQVPLYEAAPYPLPTGFRLAVPELVTGTGSGRIVRIRADNTSSSLAITGEPPSGTAILLFIAASEE